MTRSHKPNQLRIIAGTWRGRKLSFPDVAGLRPTPDRVRETVFNWLAPVLPGARCLDLFAGSGVLGFEAASRGAGVVELIERDMQIVAALRAHVTTLAATQVHVVAAEALNYLAGSASPFDIVLLDPPYDRPELLAACCTQLEVGGWLAPQARIYLETHGKTGLPALPDNWEVVRSKQAGQVAYHLAVRASM
jgi:16S rRNA (guanine966-N2)-methyltransferase